MTKRQKLEAIVFNRHNDLTDESVKLLHELISETENINPERPIVNHKHTTGILIPMNDVFGNPIAANSETRIIGEFRSNNAVFDRNLFIKSNDLLQITEMYFDELRTSGRIGTTIFELVHKTLHDLNSLNRLED